MLTIPYPNTDRSLLTIEERRVAGGLDVDDDSQDEALEVVGNYVDALITQACGVVKSGAIPPTLRLEEVIETYPATRAAGLYYPAGMTGIFLSRMPVVEVTAVTEGGSELGVDDWYVDGQGLYRYTGSARTAWGCGEISVTYSAGYDEVPYDLKYAARKFQQAEQSQGARDPLLKRVLLHDVIEKEYWVDPTKDQIVPAEVMSILENGGFINKFPWMR